MKYFIIKNNLCIKSILLKNNNFKKKIVRSWFTNEIKDEKKKMKIYTKTGDKGTSILFNGIRISKTSPIFRALGETDELNSIVGVAKEFCLEIDKKIAEKLEHIQGVLLDSGTNIATPKHNSTPTQLERASFDINQVDLLEKWIDEIDEQLPPLHNFILPGGGKASSFLHVARSVCRRAERAVVDLVEKDEIDNHVSIYLNRLSDFFFVCARYISMKEKKSDIIYKKPKTIKSEKNK